MPALLAASRPRAECFILRNAQGNVLAILKNFRLDINVFAGSLLLKFN